MSIFNKESDFNALATKLYQNYTPAFNNLFTIEVFDYASINNKNTLLNEDDSTDLYKIAQIRAKSIKLGDEELTFKRGEVSKKFSPESFKWQDTITVTWLEDASFSVKRLHQKWLKNFYCKEKDCWLSYDSNNTFGKAYLDTYNAISPNAYNHLESSGKDFPEYSLCKAFKVTFPPSIASDVGESFGSSSVASPYLMLNYVMPTNSGELSFEWGTQGKIMEHSLTYNFLDWEWGGVSNATYQ